MALGRSDSLPSSCCHIVFLEPPKPQPTRGNQKGTLGVGGVDSLGVPNPHRQLDKHCSLGGTFTSWQIIRTTSFIFIFHFARKYFGIRQNNFCTAERYLEWQKKNTSSGCVDGDPSTNMTAHHPELQLGNENFYRFSPFVAARVLIACQTIYRERNNPRPVLVHTQQPQARV